MNYKWDIRCFLFLWERRMLAWERGTALWAKQVSVLLLASIFPSHSSTYRGVHSLWILSGKMTDPAPLFKVMLFIKTDTPFLRAMLVPWPFSKSQQLSSFLLAELNFTNCFFKIHLHLNWTLISINSEDVWAHHETPPVVTKAKYRYRKKMSIGTRVVLRFVVSLCKWAQNSPEAWFVENWVLASHHFVNTYFHCCGNSHCDIL